MGAEKNQDDAASDTSTTGFTAHTPPNDLTVLDDDPYDGLDYAVPWHGNTYMIIERASGLAITLTKDGLSLQGIADGQDSSNRWLCVDRNGYFGFHDPKSGKYMGHNGNYGMRASSTKHDDWECFTPRRHPDGGYQLLVPNWWNALRVVVVAEDGKSLVTRDHGTTVWEFVKF